MKWRPAIHAMIKILNQELKGTLHGGINFSHTVGTYHHFFFFFSFFKVISFSMSQSTKVNI